MARGNNVRWSVDRRTIYFDRRLVIYCRLVTIATKISRHRDIQKDDWKSLIPPTSGATDTLLKPMRNVAKLYFCGVIFNQALHRKTGLDDQLIERLVGSTTNHNRCGYDV